MKNNIHPVYHPSITITCACGAQYTTGSTAESMHVEICAHCHPFYTGKQKLVDAARRVEKFKDKATRSTALQAAAIERSTRKKVREKEKQQEAETAIKATKEAETASKKHIRQPGK
ncbi:50S ribosomal protein L31 [Candidatus Uhrbacteria bacterium RIFCSPLOWO2_02_FULL_49_11]|uniref:Large ribosomal subunit protein bL31 n=1 Tax=Candidatus Uhrbacteria bacterium RIFCSPLOWO2_02_FULL_49_11 TaxID=1802409 RepID=A0A1F7VCB4_9BACT|nr:MAG: 50S ribosomal protein L31 [Candidatus Uhrbacteria bacterium RIFCSPLOWO2_02_FULL_49_11]